jgi:hypothetical protein
MTAQMVLCAILRRDRFIGNEASTANEGKSFAAMTDDPVLPQQPSSNQRPCRVRGDPGEGSSSSAEPCYDH